MIHRSPRADVVTPDILLTLCVLEQARCGIAVVMGTARP
jgi:hypothetical protein